jgi:hypothetical protein
MSFNYKYNNIDISNSFNIVNQTYYGNVTTNFKNNGINIGSQISLKTFSYAPNSITPFNFTTLIYTYNTGNTWTVAPTQPGNSNWRSVSISSNGQYGIACIDNGQI